MEKAMTTREEFQIPEPGAPKVAAFLQELTDLSRKHKIALNGYPTMFVMEPEDMGTEYVCDDDSIVSFG
jgi:hypothetical protein